MGKHIFLLGPTATGKSKTGAILANLINGEVISLDSMQIYKGLPILSAQPSKEELDLAPPSSGECPRAFSQV